VPFRIAALTTNFGWSPGAIMIGSHDHDRLWPNSTPTALAVQLAPGASVSRVRGEIRAALGPGGGLEVLSAHERAQRFVSIAREGLAQLQQISQLLLIAAILALAAALGSAIWQRRVALAGLRLSGVPPRRLRRIVSAEVALMLLAGAVTGVIAGICGQVVLDEYLTRVTGFPVASVAASVRPLQLLAIAIAAIAAIMALPVVLASRVSPELALEAD
jgi:putative ABC transport system permease protein